MKALASYLLDDMALHYWQDESGYVGWQLLPAGRVPPDDPDKRMALEPLAQFHVLGDPLPNGYGNGMTMACTAASTRMKLKRHFREDDCMVTELKDETGREVIHTVRWHEGLQALRVTTRFVNGTSTPLTLELLSSLNIGGITPYTPGDATGQLYLHRARSAWSAEGRMRRESLESLQLEPAWLMHNLHVEKFGQKGSMPVRGFFPFAAVEDASAGITWAMQLACPGSWQMEIRRRDHGVCMMASLADWDYGQWRKTLKPGEGFTAPEAYVTVGEGSPDSVFQRLQTIHRENWCGAEKPLPVLFNEYCTTWGNPSHANLERIADTIGSHSIDYMVIDSGWYGNDDDEWYNSVGDWEPNEKKLFPQGLRATADMIRAHGMIPGIWFELEDCAVRSRISRDPDMLLHREGHVIDTDNRRFLDMRKDEVRRYLDEHVAGLLNRCGFGYIKIDYNDSIGMGCDGADSLGEGLRQVLEGTRDYFRRLKELTPGLVVENCASGGHRLEPSMLAVSDLSSFSDAHECQEIPVIAANLHRLMLPGQSQIWAVLRKEDDLKRLNYSLVNTLLGVMCLSGDVYDLSDAQWAQIDRTIAFYRSVESVIRKGRSRIAQHISESWRHLQGWQMVDRLGENGDRLVVIHRFGGDAPAFVEVPVAGFQIADTLSAHATALKMQTDTLQIPLPEAFDAIAIHLTPTK